VEVLGLASSSLSAGTRSRPLREAYGRSVNPRVALTETTTTDVADKVVHALLNPGLVSLVSNPNQEQVRGVAALWDTDPVAANTALQPAAGSGVHGRCRQESGDVETARTGR
jgi:hypothetical protein